MKIAYVITRADSVGGASIHVLEMSRAMMERGHDVLVLIGGKGPVSDRIAAAGIRVRELRFLRRAIRPDRDLAALLELRTEIERFAPALVSTHTAKAGWLGAAACAALHIPVVHTPHGLPLGDRMPYAASASFRVAERIASRWRRRIICVCEHERRLALANRVAPEELLSVVHNGVRPVPDELRAKPGVAPPRVISVARFESPKDNRTTIRALALLRDLAWECEFVGDGPDERACRLLAKELGIADRFLFSGYRADVASALAQAQVFVLSSRSEALPRSVLEAMRAGLPVVASAVGGVPEIVTKDRNGLLVPPGDEKALAEALGRLLRDPGLAAGLGSSARAEYERRFTLDRMIAETVGVYEDILHA